MTEKQEADRHFSVHLADRLNQARSFVECARLAVSSATIDRDDEAALMTVLDEAIERIRGVSEELAPKGRGLVAESDEQEVGGRS